MTRVRIGRFIASRLVTTVVGIVVAFAATCGAGRDAFAAQLRWTGAADNNWLNSANWTLLSGSDADGIPDANDDVVFDIAGIFNAPVLTTSQTIDTLAIGGTFTGVVTVSGFGTNLTVDGADNNLDSQLGLLALPDNQAVVISGGTLRITDFATLDLVDLLGDLHVIGPGMLEILGFGTVSGTDDAFFGDGTLKVNGVTLPGGILTDGFLIPPDVPAGVPEPSPLLLVGLGALVLWRHVRRASGGSQRA